MYRRFHKTSTSLLGALAVGLSLAAAPSAWAVQPSSVHRILFMDELRLDHLIDMLNRRLHPSDAQQRAIRPILQKYVDRAQAIRQAPNLDADDKQEQLRQLSELTEGMIARRLDHNQQRRLLQIWTLPAGKRQGGQFDYLARKLHLNEGQRRAIQPIIAEYERRLHAIRQDPNFDRDDKQAEARDLKASTESKIARYLKPQQRDVFNSYWDHQVE